MPDVFISTPRGQMPAYLAVPSNPGPVPGVVVLHDVGGMSVDHRNQANFLKLLRWTGIGYNEAATMDARRRITVFFHAHLGGCNHGSHE